MVKTGLYAAWLLVLTVFPLHAVASQDLLIEAELIPQQVYVQAQAVYRLRFYQSVDVSNLRMLPPSARLAEIRPIGEERIFEAERAGRRYRVHERSYAVFPFASGALDLTAAQVTGRAIGQQAMPLQAPPMTLNVLPASAGAGNVPWLPARSLILSEHWLSTPEALQLGKAVRRSVRVEAGGVDAAQIPELQLVIPGMMVHAESARLENHASGNFNVGIREQTFSLVPLVSGALSVPELRLSWWNSDTDEPATAILPARTLQVAATPGEAKPTAVARPVAVVVNSSAGLKTSFAEGWYGAAIMAVLLLIPLWLMRVRIRSYWCLLTACRSGDVGAVRDALLAWASRFWPDAPPLTLAALAVRLDDAEAQQVLAELERDLYGRDSGHYRTSRLFVAVRQVQRGVKASRRASGRARWHNGRVSSKSRHT